MKDNINKIIGYCLIAGVLLVCIPYMLLITKFNYPDILRESPEKILLNFFQSGSSLICTWLSFSFLGLPLIVANILIGQRYESKSYFIRWATVLGVLGFTFQIIALLRWVFVVPIIAKQFVNGNNTEKIIAVSNFKIVHQFGGVLLGESLGQLFTIIWSIMIASFFIQINLFPKKIHIFGISSSIIYLTAQLEYIHLVIPDLFYFRLSGLIGSTLWLIYLFIIGVYFARLKKYRL
jgi:hypothetical protein